MADSLQAIIFDIDGTLVQSVSEDDRIYRESVISVLGPVRFRQDLLQYDHITDEGILLQIFEDNELENSSDVTADVKSEFIERTRQHLRSNGPFNEIPGARNYLRQLNESNNCRVGIATGGWHDSAQLKLAAAGFDVAGIPLASSDDAIGRTDIMQIALSRLNTDCASALYFGDGAWDRAACEALGWEFRPVGRVLGGIDNYHELNSPIPFRENDR
jgi:phosphoglycolate phosphatase-like HAD superfamily hydrolase